MCEVSLSVSQAPNRSLHSMIQRPEIQIAAVLLSHAAGVRWDVDGVEDCTQVVVAVLH